VCYVFENLSAPDPGVWYLKSSVFAELCFGNVAEIRRVGMFFRLWRIFVLEIRHLRFYNILLFPSCHFMQINANTVTDNG
jgi:hypothetical protein